MPYKGASPTLCAPAFRVLRTIVLQERHRLVGLDKIGVVAEIWIHTDSNNLSDENDIVRINDDYNRT